MGLSQVTSVDYNHSKTRKVLKAPEIQKKLWQSLLGLISPFCAEGPSCHLACPWFLWHPGRLKGHGEGAQLPPDKRQFLFLFQERGQ